MTVRLLLDDSYNVFSSDSTYEGVEMRSYKFRWRII
jgi:hypothetical protein